MLIVLGGRVRVAIIHDWLRRSKEIGRSGKAPLHDAIEFDLMGELDFIRASLTSIGHEVAAFAVDDAPRLCDFLSSHRPDLVFNLCDTFGGSAALEMNVAALYELHGIAYTGCPPLALGISLNKPLAKSVLSAHGIRTPAYAVIDKGQDLFIVSDQSEEQLTKSFHNKKLGGFITGGILGAVGLGLCVMSVAGRYM